MSTQIYRSYEEAHTTTIHFFPHVIIMWEFCEFDGKLLRG